MRSIRLSIRLSIAVCCVAGVARGDEGVVRISDADSQPGVVRIQDRASQPPATEEPSAAEEPKPAAIRQNYTAIYRLDNQPANIQPVSWSVPARMIVPVSHMAGCGNVSCSPGCAVPPMTCCDQNCFPQGGYASACPATVCEGAYCSDSCQSCYVGDSCNNCYYAPGHKQRVLTLFAKADPATGCHDQGPCKRWVRGQQRNYLARNQRLSNHLFGWLVPAGHLGAGSPPFGKYQITYADQPAYTHPQDGQAWGAQGYGVPCTVPVPPTVRYSYNYSWGLPASRLTPIGQPVPGPGPQPLVKQTW